jgi:hypothetical protein
MIRALIFAAVLFPLAAFAQSNSGPGSKPTHHGHTTPDHMAPARQTPATVPLLPGQDAFAAIQEIVSLLESDPATDWSKVDIDGLRRHLVDMNRVTLMANIRNEPIDAGMRFAVTGSGDVEGSIRRMVLAQAATMNGADGWRFAAAQIDGGAALTVHPPARDLQKLRGLGFLGVMTRGMHHQAHHIAIARGTSPHAH